MYACLYDAYVRMYVSTQVVTLYMHMYACVHDAYVRMYVSTQVVTFLCHISSHHDLYLLPILPAVRALQATNRKFLRTEARAGGHKTRGRLMNGSHDIFEAILEHYIE